MKSPQEFRVAVYDKRGRKILAQKRVRLLTALPLAALIVVCGALLVPGLTEKATVSPGRVPLALQVGKPAEPRRITYEYYSQLKEETGKEYSDFTQEDYDELEEKYQNAVTENQRIEKEFQSALNEFARDSAGVLSEQFEGNSCFCPLSLYYALSLCGAGAQGETEQEFVELLHAPATDWAAEQCGSYYRQHYSPNDPDGSQFNSFQLANSLWLDGRCSFSGDYIAAAEEHFYASLFQADFTDPAVGGEITRWVKENTDGLLAPEVAFDPDTMLAILNTVYFKAAWADEFSKDRNQMDDFTKADGSTVTAEYMTQTDLCGSGLVGSGFLRAELPLRGGFQMIFILPDEGVDPLSLLRDPDAFEQMFYPVEEQAHEVHWRLPKFSFDCDYDLLNSLKALGLETATDGERADFSGMYDRLPQGYERLFLSQARQGVHMGVDELGVEAAAYTMLYMEAAGEALLNEAEILEMDLSRPFLFAIVADDEVTQPASGTNWYVDGHSVLFVGVCADPTQK